LNRLAVIDIGTHSILYFLGEINKNNQIIMVDQAVQAARLGRNIESQGIIEEQAIKKAIDILNRLNQKALDQKANRIIVVGTRVFRAAMNQKLVCKRIRKETGFDVEVLSDQEEARWSYIGATYGRCIDQSVIVLDIGGGSTEFVYGKDNHICELISINLGAVNLTEKCIHHDPPLKQEVDVLLEMIHVTLKKKVYPLLRKGEQIIASGGTATTLAAFQLQLDCYRPNRVDGYVMSVQDLESSINQIMFISLLQRQQLLSFDPARADIILAGSMILKTIMSAGGFENVMISDQGLPLGIALKALQSNQPNH